MHVYYGVLLPDHNATSVERDEPNQEHTLKKNFVTQGPPSMIRLRSTSTLYPEYAGKLNILLFQPSDFH